MSDTAKDHVTQRRMQTLGTHLCSQHDRITSKTHDVLQTMLSRPRRNRRAPAIRESHTETWLAPSHFVYPLFIHSGTGDIEVASMPGRKRLCLTSLMDEVAGAIEDGIGMVEVFPAVEESLKTAGSEEAWNPNGLVQIAIRRLKSRWPELVVVTDVALDPYNIDGHDGLVDDNGVIVNDASIAALVKQALSHAEAGADIIAPSDMQDGRALAIRRALDEHGYSHVSILSYTAKYASAFYGPFRDALGSAPKSGTAGGKPIPSHKKTYQMDPGNKREALREAALDEAEGVDIMMVKPAMAYLDIIHVLRESSHLPIAAYQVSGEYAMIKAACKNGWLNEKDIVMELLMSIRRAGADIIFTYFARDAARYLKEGYMPGYRHLSPQGGLKKWTAC